MDLGDLVDQRNGLRYPLQPSPAFQEGYEILEIGVVTGNWDISFHAPQIEKKEAAVFALAQMDKTHPALIQSLWPVALSKR